MILEKLRQHGVDLDRVMKRFLGKEDMYLKFLKRFLEDESFSNMERYLEQNNVEEAFKAAHTLKGVVTNLGLESIMCSVLPITEELRAGSLEEGKNMMEQLKKEYEMVVNILKKNLA